MRIRRRVLGALIGGLLLPLTTALWAETTLAPPAGTVVLTVSGSLDKTNSGDTAQFDIEMLRALPSQSFSTTTIWTEGVHVFTGVPLGVLLETLGVSGGTLHAWALNEYMAEIPVAEITPDVPIIAYEMNGRPMPRREKGPLWVVYPYDSSPAYQSETIYARSVWQLDVIEVLENQRTD